MDCFASLAMTELDFGTDNIPLPNVNASAIIEL
jgi:hypothetical protein